MKRTIPDAVGVPTFGQSNTSPSSTFDDGGTIAQHGANPFPSARVTAFHRRA